MSEPETPPGGNYAFLPHLLHLAVPIALQTFMMTALNFADTFMVGQLGEVAIGAIALGNQIFFVLMLLQFGVGGGGLVFSSQYWGRGDIRGVRRALGASLVFAFAGAGIFTLGAVLIPEALLQLFTRDPRVVETGTPYLRIVGLSYLCTAVSMAYTHALRSIGNTKLPMYATGISILLNILGNYILIFGVFGFPALGVTGAAIATAIARLIEMGIILSVVYLRRSPVAASFRELTDWSAEFVKRFVRRASPVVANELLWATGFTMYTVVFGRMGTSYLAAYNVADTVGRLLMVIFIATAQATAVLIGNEIGAGRKSLAGQFGATIMHHVPILAAVVGAAGFFLLAPVVPRLFSVGPEVQLLVRQFTRLFSLLLIIKTVNLHIIIGILRGGADTTFALIIDIAPLWLIGVPAAIVTGLVLDLPAQMVYIALNAEELTRLLFGWRRVRSGRWVHDITDGEKPQLPGIEAAGAP
ncbi:MAG: MATE family efflux transporter [Spirochaetaceae bacterium]